MNSKTLKGLRKTLKAQGLLHSGYYEKLKKEFNQATGASRIELIKLYQGKENIYEKTNQ